MVRGGIMKEKRRGVAISDIIALLLVVSSLMGILFAIMYQENIRTEQVKEGKIIYITARQWIFEPNHIVVKRGETITLVVYSVDVLHGFEIEKLGIDKIIYPGNEVRITVTFDKPGEYIFRCSKYCGEPWPGSGMGHWAMKGKITVIG